MSTLTVWDRKSKSLFAEKILGEGAIHALYGNKLAMSLAGATLSASWFSKLYGAYQSTPLSRGSIEKFVHDFAIPMHEFEERRFKHFNDFFIRKFKTGVRCFEEEPNILPAFAEGRYFGFESITDNTPLPVKGATLNLSQLLGDSPLVKSFKGGPGYIARLCPVDYHRFHFSDHGRILYSTRMHGPLHSVNPIALKAKGDILFTNERQVQVLETKNFGNLAMVEVGALGVGKIVQTHPGSQAFRRGDEKGYFLFGGSTVILIGEPGSFKIDADILAKTREGMECMVRLGERIASK